MNFLIKVLLIFSIIYLIFRNKESFDGYGKTFGFFYHPIPKCHPGNNCFAGSYVREMPYNTNPDRKKYLNCCVNKHLKRRCHWKNYSNNI